MIRKYRLGSLPPDKDTGWRAYQETLKRNAQKRRFWQRIPWWGFLTLVIGAVICVGYGASVIGIWPGDTSARLIDQKEGITTINADNGTTNTLDKQAIRRMLADIDPNRVTAETITLENDGTRYQIETTIDSELQNALVDKLRLEHARYLSIVVLDPATGHILSMISHDRIDRNHNTCVDNRFPAASIFKIVTASAAIEACNLGPNSTMTYNGRKYSLYKSQLKDRRNKYTRRITFEDAFAQSINPVFGKLGAHRLGKDKLLSYAEAFGFNREFDLDFRMAPSRFTVSDNAPYQWAEMASGFNQETTLSPLHGAMIAAAILNAGNLIEPTLIDSVTDETGQIVYRGQADTIQKAIETRTAGIMSKFMRTTISEGTAKKTFRGYGRDRVLSKLDLGGKTGSINNDPRYDWFVGFARDKAGDQSVVVSVLVAHEKFIGIKSGQYARMAMKAYFEDYFAKKDTPATSTAGNTSNG